MNYKHLEYPIIGFKISVALFFAVLFIGLGALYNEAHGQNIDSISVEPYHIINSDHPDTLVLQGFSVRHLVDTSGTAVFLYDPEEGIWRFSSVLSSGLIENN